MSTSYVTGRPIKLRLFKKLAQRIGYTWQPDSEGKRTLADDDGFLHDLMAVKISRKTYVCFTRYGRGNVSNAVDYFDCLSEHDEEYDELFGIDDEDPEDDEE